MQNLKKHFPTIIALFVLAISILTAFHSSISAILSHGITWHILIPPMALIVAWKKSILPAAPKSGVSSYVFGTMLVLGAFLVIFTGDVTSTQALTELGIVVGLWGCILFIGGYPLFASLLWPLLYLLFVSSLTEGTFDIFTNFFRNASAQTAFLLSRITGFSIMHNGTYLRLPMMTLNVANECSGINHFISLAAISLPLAVLSQKKTWPIILIVLSSFPIALFSNSLRVFFLIIYNYNRMEFSHGPKNILVTGVGFFFGLLILYGLASLLSRLIKGTSSTQTTNRWALFKQCVNTINRKSIYILSTVLIIMFTLLSLWKINPAEQPLLFSQHTPALPNHCSSVKTFPGIDTIPDTDNHLILNCNSTSQAQSYLLLGWYAQQEQNREMCGYNWNRFFTRTGKYEYLSGNRRKVDFNLYRSHSEANQYQFLITYRSGKHYTADPLKIRLYMFLEALIHRSTSGTILILAVPTDKKNDLPFDKYTENILDIFFPVIDSTSK
jgi:exosortase